MFSQVDVMLLYEFYDLILDRLFVVIEHGAHNSEVFHSTGEVNRVDFLFLPLS